MLRLIFMAKHSRFESCALRKRGEGFSGCSHWASHLWSLWTLWVRRAMRFRPDYEKSRFAGCGAAQARVWSRRRPFWVINGPGRAETGLSKCPREQTFTVLVGMSRTCHFRTHAPPEI